MRVYISADIEGVTGVVTWGQAGRPSSECYDWPFARRMMTHDVNAAIRGARAAGADEVVVKDSHGGGKNLLIEDLEHGVELISGSGCGKLGMMEGIDGGFDCAMLIGYHAMAGTPHGIMEHTISGNVHRFSVNGVPTGEMGLSLATAGQFGVPLVAVSSDLAGCKEAEGIVSGVHTAVVKEANGRYMGKTLHPSVTGPLIEEAARQGVESRARITPWCPEGAVSLELEWNRTEEADACAQMLGWERVDGYVLTYEAADWAEAHIAARRAMDAGRHAAGSGK